MKIYSVFDPEFRKYGQVIEGYDLKDLLDTLDAVTPLPPEKTAYVASQPELEALPVYQLIQDNLFGGMPIQLGWCNGHNTRMNCLEYHRDSEINLGTEDFILLLAKREEIEDGFLDSGLVKAFRCPAGVMIEVYATTMHFAPCSAEKGKGFKVLVALPRGTNGPKPSITPLNAEDQMLRARNKWLLAHADSNQAKDGAVVAIKGENIDICDDI